MEELTHNTPLATLPDDIQKALNTLLGRINIIRTEWANSMVVTSGLRTHADQIRIYKAKGIPEDKIPWGSQHLTGGAVDIFDPEKKLQAWCMNNQELLKNTGLWMESFHATPNWCHFQINPYKSYSEGKSIFFNP